MCYVLILKLRAATSQCLHPRPLWDPGRPHYGGRAVAPFKGLAV